MIRTIPQGNLDINNRIASQNTGLHSTLDTVVDSRDVFLRDGTANDGVDELVTLAGLVGLDLDLNMTILALTTGLTCVLGLLVGLFADGLTVSNLRCTHVCFNLELTQQTVNDDLQVQLAHTGDDGLTGLFVSVGLEGRILFGQLCQRDAHLLVAGLGLRLDGNADNRLGELHGLQNDGMILITQSVTGSGVLQTDNSSDITCVAAVDILAVVRMHLQDAAHTLLAVLHGVVDSGTCLNLTGVNTEVCQLTNERVGSDLEGQSCEGSVVGRRTGLLFLSLGIHALDVRDIGRSGHIVNDSVQQLLDTTVLVGRTADNGNQRVSDGLLADRSLQLGTGDLLALEVLFHELFVVLSNSLDQNVVVLLGLLTHILGDGLSAHVVAHVVVVDLSVHIDQVNDTAEGILLTDRQLDCHAVCVQTIVQHLDAAEEVGTHGVHLVDVHHTGNLVLVSLTPNGLRLRLNTALCSQNGHRTVQHAQGTLDLNSEVHVARGVDDVDAVTVLLECNRILLGLRVAPVAGGSSGSDGDTTLLLLNHPVHGSAAIMNFADLVVDTGVVQNTLGSSSFTSINVGHNADISRHLKRNFSGCSHEINLLQNRSITEMSESLVSLCHLVSILTLLHGVTSVVGSIHDFSSQTLSHGLLTTAAAVGSQPAQTQGLAASRADFQRNLVVSTANAAGLALEAGHDVLHRLLESLQRIVAGLLLNHGESFVNDLLSDALLAIQHNAVDQTSDHLGIVNRIS